MEGPAHRIYDCLDAFPVVLTDPVRVGLTTGELFRKPIEDFLFVQDLSLVSANSLIVACPLDRRNLTIFVPEGIVKGGDKLSLLSISVMT